MALYMKIPKDMNNIKDKVIWKLTKRQVIFFGIGFALGFIVYWLTYKILGMQTASILFFGVGCPFFLAGNYEKDGITLEKMALNIIRYKLYPKIRPYRTENVYRQIKKALEYKEEVEMLETGRKKVKISKN